MYVYIVLLDCNSFEIVNLNVVKILGFRVWVGFVGFYICEYVFLLYKFLFCVFVFDVRL